LVLAVVALVAMAGGVALALQSEDPYRPGTTHDVTLVNDQPECAHWMAHLGDDHAWRNTEDVPADWVSPMDGELRILSEDDAVFEADTGGSVPLWGGELYGDPPKGFTADCPSTLAGR
jgi:hypothetical protein